MNGDVCVVDDYCSVVIIDKDGQLRCKYPVSDKSTNNHGYCYGIACDKLGNVLISDMDNNRIHQLDKDGNFVQFVLTKLDGIFRPYGLSIDKKGQLWVCNDSGNEVRVYKYRS
ncbi:hypothetical protein KUTeg_024144 [Tegillarca granosa]|uniref:Uncharacterized protein n=1 Tax=Tegillarca granosa TaxID=220873 RepID=A0ABQ9E2U9_TEGGR|nr:hypothetical protein KUTeg_024144 [Tegillarca granosa]